MHEMSLARNILEIVQSYAPARVKSVRIRVGALSAVMPESLKFSFDVIREGTAASEAVLLIDHVPVRCLCRKCINEFSADTLGFICPQCFGTDVATLSGNELDVVELELEE